MQKRRDLEPFRFKKFTVNHNYSTLAVGTDAILLASWTNCAGKKHILEVGTGCGLIALALAQKCEFNTQIDAIDIDKESVFEAQENFDCSSWKNRLSAFHASFQDWNKSIEKYDLIVCNPPFFRDSLKNTEQHKIFARHQESFDLIEFAKFCKNQAKPSTLVALIYPFLDTEFLIEIFKKEGFYLSNRKNIYPKKSKPGSRSLLEFTLTPTELTIENNLIIYEEDNTYSTPYKDFTKAYYLNF